MKISSEKESGEPDKQELRRRLRVIRESLTSEQIAGYSAAICQKIERFVSDTGAEVIHMYLPIANRGEVDTMPLAEKLLKEGRTVIVPVTPSRSPVLKHIALERTDTLVFNKWGIPEPPPPYFETPLLSQLDLVLVPMLGGDYNGNRIGYGKGFYDRFLKEVKCPKIGLLFDCCLVGKIPAEKHDITLNYLVTERRIVKLEQTNEKHSTGA